MKKLLLLSFVLFLSCKRTESENNTKNQYDDISTTQKRIDTIFLGYTFDMSKTEYDKHTLKLIKEKSLTKNKEYDFKIPEYPMRCIIDKNFYQDKLYTLTLKIQPYTGDSPHNTQDYYTKILEIFGKKYNFTQENFATYNHEESNLKIQIITFQGFILIEYTDQPVYKRVKKINDSLQNETDSKTVDRLKKDI